MNDSSKVLLAALGGAIVGAGVALLLAPVNGKEAREKIKDGVSTAKDGLSDLVNRGKSFVQAATGRAKDEVDQLVQDGKQQVNHAANAFNRKKEEMKEI